ncbi:MAG: hydroxyquinol 1,2-dioxygenase [Gammaproteobacteria bacterium]|nr:hydroxyquinol 1,2-dioxygenase [Gammaproteobacteria bacterium]
MGLHQVFLQNKLMSQILTRFGSLEDYEKGRVEAISDDVKHYAFSNCYDIAKRAKPYERVVFGINQIYVLEVVRAEGVSPWYHCAHDEFVLNMDNKAVEVHLMELSSGQRMVDPEKNGAVLLHDEPLGKKMGWIKIGRGHQAMLPKNRAYQFRAVEASVLIIQTCKGELSVERWAEICQTH